MKMLRGRVVPSAKNAPARDVYERHGFVRLSEEAGGAVLWERDLHLGGVTMPDWFRLVA